MFRKILAQDKMQITMQEMLKDENIYHFAMS